MDKQIKISGTKTINDWLTLKDKLEEDFDNTELWEVACSFLEERLQSRYLVPIKAIETHSNIEGEGLRLWQYFVRY